MRMGRWSRGITALAVGVSLAAAMGAGCTKSASVRGQPISADAVARIVDGQTTEAEIREWFGAPADVVMTNNGKVLTYRYRKEAGGALSLPLLGIGGGVTSGQLLIVTLEDTGKVTRHTFIAAP